jgi:hypothetical protein
MITLFVLLLVLILVIFMSGCTSNNQIVNKTYQGNGVSFNYPSDYVITESNGSSGQFLNGSSGQKTFEVSKIGINESFKIFTLRAKQLTEKSLTNPTVFINNETNLTIDGSNAYQLSFMMTVSNKTGLYTWTVFDKKDSRYIIRFKNDYTYQDTKTVLDSFNVN